MPFLPTCMDGSLLTLFRHMCEFIANFISSSSSATPPRRWAYDIFLSYHGKDTRNNFVDHLYAAFEQAGLHTFKDDKNIQRGESIPLELTKAIQESRIHVVVFSKNYASSTWCLGELAEIIQCQNATWGQNLVIPVFVQMNPSDVRRQEGSFRAAFAQHEVNFINDMEKVNRWREALETAANISGWDVSKTASGCEAECIKLIVQHIVNYMASSTRYII